jgi:3-oxoacyl-[acyl-carrier-protein] synthase-1
MRKVVVTGIGIISPLGRGLPSHVEALRAGRSGVIAMPEWEQYGLRSLVAGACPWEPYEGEFDRKDLRFLSPAVVLAGAALRDAITDAGLAEEDVQSDRTAIVAGTGAGASIIDAYELGLSIRNTGNGLKCDGQSLQDLPRSRRLLLHYLGVLDLGALNRQRP